MKNPGKKSNTLLDLEQDKAILLLEIEYLLQAINSGDLDARKGYDAIVNMVSEQQEVSVLN